MLRIFISYRRKDSDIWADRVADVLRREFGRERVFQDFSSIDPGSDFAQALEQALGEAAVTLVVIGPQWLSATDKQGRRRLDQPGDFVCLEVAESLKRPAVRVFPLLVDGAQMPTEDELPASLQALARRQALELTVRHWDHDVAQLVRLLRQVPGLDETAPKAAAAAPPEPSRPRRWPVLAGVAALLVLASALFVSWLGSRRGAPEVAEPAGAAQMRAAPATAAPEPAAPAEAVAVADFRLRGQDGLTSVSNLSQGLVELSERLQSSSSGRARLEILPAGSVVPTSGLLDAVARGTLDFGWVGPGIFSGKDMAFQLLDSPPFGPAPPRYAAWRRDAAVVAAADRLYAAHGVKGLPCGVVPGTDLWSLRPVRNEADLKGLKLRSSGLRNEILAGAGAHPVVLPAGELYPALANGVIDGVLSFGPSVGSSLGLNKLARHLYHPGRVTPSSGIDLLVNLERWQQLGGAGQRLLQQACERNAAQMLERWLDDQRVTAAKLAQQGLTVEPLPDPVVAALRDSWRRVQSAHRDEPAFTALVDSLPRYAAAK